MTTTPERPSITAARAAGADAIQQWLPLTDEQADFVAHRLYPYRAVLYGPTAGEEPEPAVSEAA